MFIGRKQQLKLLEEAYGSTKSCLSVIYGRRRVGKSSLVKQFSLGKPYFYSFEGLEKEDTPGQIENVKALLQRQFDDTTLKDINFNNWRNVLDYISDKLVKRRSKKKVVLSFDEFQWMAAGRNKLISLIKFYWDNYWKDNNVMLILCGSVASFMVKRVLSSKALYGRINLEILLKGLPPHEAALLFEGKRSKEEILKYLLILGGIPKYLEEINLNRSFNLNINRLCFRKHSLMLEEINRIFYSQFRETKIYLRIVKLLETGIYSQVEISRSLGIASGGGLKEYLDNLELAEIVRSYVPYNKSISSKFRKYTLADEFLIFYFKFIAPNLRTIEESSSQKLFEAFSRDNLNIWLGFAFERYCIKNAAYLSEIMGFRDEVLTASPYFERENRNFQVDLLYKRMDNVITLCEIKHVNTKIPPSVIPEVERKSTLFKVPRGYTIEKALISLYGPDKALADSGYFAHHVTLTQFFDKSHPVA
ncbi:MAG: AAA family ATPase [bacterium]|nr:AAA family ATPase [bacterium]